MAGSLGQGQRRMLVLGACAGLAMYFAGWPLHRPWITLAGLILFAACGVLLRMATRNLADLPAEALDERQWAVRNALYVTAYRITGGLMAVLSLACVAASVSGVRQVDLELVTHALLTALFAAIVAPSCVLAWTEKEL